MDVRRVVFGGLLLSSVLPACGDKSQETDLGECLDYIACAEATGEPTATIEAIYGEDGTCWNDEEDAQTVCRAYCTDAIEILAEAYPSEPACGGSTTPTSPYGCTTTPVGTGYSEGDVAHDFTLTDQTGEDVSLYDYCGAAVVLVFEAGWSPTASDSMDQVRRWMDDFGDETFMVLTLIGADEDGESPTEEYVASFAEEYDVSTPVLADPGTEVLQDYFAGGIPTFVLLGSGAEIIAIELEGIPDEQIEAALP